MLIGRTALAAEAASSEAVLFNPDFGKGKITAFGNIAEVATRGA